MIKAYVEGFTTQFEGEDIEIDYAVYEDEELLEQGQEFKSYQKPVLVGLVAMNALLNILDKYGGQEILIIINDPALLEQVNGTSATKNTKVVEMGKKIRNKIAKFGDKLNLKDISNQYIEREKFAEILKKIK
ncbi:MAG: hypothetical protein JW702_05390 [Clostridiales bacterium]|nr:hypothetical protein [Clostridiales bacterium]